MQALLVIAGCLCALSETAEGQVWNRTGSRAFGSRQADQQEPVSDPARSVRSVTSFADPPAVARATAELPEPKVDVQMPKMASQQRFELNQDAFSQPRTAASATKSHRQSGPSARALNNISSGNSSRPLPRLANRSMEKAAPAVRTRNQTTKSEPHAQRPAANSDSGTETSRGSEAIYTADEEDTGFVVAPMPQRTNVDGTRTPVASFGEWDVRRDDVNRRSMRAATLTDDESGSAQSPSFHVPMSDFSRQSEGQQPETTTPAIPNAGPSPENHQASTPPLVIPDSAAEELARDTDNLLATDPGQSVHFPSQYGTSVQNHELYWWERELAGSLMRDRPPMPMSLPEALQLALNEAPELKILHADWYIQMQEQIRQDAAFDWTTFVDSVWNRDSTPVGSQLDGAAQRLRSRTASASAGLRRLDRYGGQLEISQQLGLRESNSQFISPNNQGNSRLNLRYERPLLRSAGKDYTTGPLQLSELDKDIAFDRMQSGIQDHLLEVARAYWALVLTRGDFLQKITSWNRARAIADEMQSRADIDVTPGTLDRARAEVSSRLASTIQSEHDVQSAQEVLLELIYASRYTLYARNEIITTTLPPHDPSSVDVDSQTDIAVQTRSEVHQAIREIRAASLEYQLSQVDLKPRLDLVLSGYSAGLNPNFDVGNSFVNQFNQGEPGAGIGLEYELPYRNRAAKAAAEQNRIAVTRLQREFEDIVGEVKQDVRSQAIRRNKFAATLPQQAESLALARRLMDYTQTRRDFLADGVQVGDLYLTDLLQIQSRVQNAEFQYLQAQISFAVADNAYLRSLASLQTLADSGTSIAGQSANPQPTAHGSAMEQPQPGPSHIEPAPIDAVPPSDVPSASRKPSSSLWLPQGRTTTTTPAPLTRSASATEKPSSPQAIRSGHAGLR